MAADTQYKQGQDQGIQTGRSNNQQAGYHLNVSRLNKIDPGKGPCNNRDQWMTSSPQDTYDRRHLRPTADLVSSIGVSVCSPRACCCHATSLWYCVATKTPITQGSLSGTQITYEDTPKGRPDHWRTSGKGNCLATPTATPRACSWRPINRHMYS